MEPFFSEDPFIVLYGEKVDIDDDIYPDPYTVIEYGDTAQLHRGLLFKSWPTILGQTRQTQI
jgi:hypothetical protein